MADPYRSFAPPLPPHERDLRGTFPRYLPFDGSSVRPDHTLGAGDLQGTSDVLRNDVLPLRPGSYGLDDPAAVGHPAASGLNGLAAGARARVFNPLEDTTAIRRDSSVGVNPGIPVVEHSTPLLKPDGLSGDESSILYVDGLPTDCTRREVAHLFRPFIGFKDIRVVHKEPRRPGDKGYVMCFVEFSDAKCALTAMEALQEYRFDDKKPDTPVLKIQFARFPFRPPLARDDRRRGSVH